MELHCDGKESGERCYLESKADGKVRWKVSYLGQ